MKEYIKLTQSVDFVIWFSCFVKYYKNKELTIQHRENGKPATIFPNGTKKYYNNGELTGFFDSRTNEYHLHFY